MSKAVLHLAVGQFSPKIGKPADNLDWVERLSAQAACEGATLILFPEDCLTGYPAEQNRAFDIALSHLGGEHRRLKQISRDNKITIAAGYIERLGEHCHSAHFIAFPDDSHAVVRKYSVDDRDRHIGITPAAPHEDKLVIEGKKAALAICMDGTEAFFADARKMAAEILLHPSGGACAISAHAGDANAEQIDASERAGCDRCVESVKTRAKQLNVAYLVANPVGFDGQRGYPGNSFIVSPAGELLAHLPGTAIIEQMKPAFVVAKVEFER